MALLVLRTRQTRLLALPLAKVVPWLPVAVAGLTMVGVATFTSPGALLFRTRFGSLALAAVTAFVLDDHAAETLAGSPTALAARRAMRILGGLILTAVLWALTLAIVRLRLPAVVELPVRGLLVEVGAYLLLGWAVSALAARWASDRLGGIAGALAVAFVAGSAWLSPTSWWPVPPDPAGPGAIGELARLAVLSLGILIWASLDPARRRGISPRDSENRLPAHSRQKG